MRRRRVTVQTASAAIVHASMVPIQVSLAALARRETRSVICPHTTVRSSCIPSAPNRSLGSWKIRSNAAFVSAARAGSKSVSRGKRSPVCAYGPRDCTPSAIANTIVRSAPVATVSTPSNPKTAAVVSTSAGASPSGVSTGMAIARLTCSGEMYFGLPTMAPDSAGRGLLTAMANRKLVNFKKPSAPMTMFSGVISR